MAERRSLERARTLLLRAVESLGDAGDQEQSDNHGQTPTAEQPAQLATPRAAATRTSTASVSAVVGERNRLFNYSTGTGRKRSPSAAGKGKRKKRASLWSHDFVCLAKRTQSKPPSSLEAGELLRAGLGKKHLSFYHNSDSSEVHIEILEAFPQLSTAGGYQLMRVGDTGGQRNELRVIPPPPEGYTIAYLQEVLRQAKVYVRPLQKDLMLTPIADDRTEVSISTGACWYQF